MAGEHMPSLVMRTTLSARNAYTITRICPSLILPKEVQPFVHRVFERSCFLVQSLGVHSVAPIVHRLSDSRAM